MPIYAYRCDSCGEQEEKLEGISAPTEHDCVQCGVALGMRRQLSVTSFTLAGGGWHAQGYGHGSGKKASDAKAETPAPAPSGGCAGGCACHAAKPGN